MSHTRYDLIIIGAGSVGVPTALFCAKQGMKVLVLDKNRTAGQGEHKCAIGGIRATHSDPAKIRLTMASRDFFAAYRGRTGFDIHWRQGGYLYPAYTQPDAELLQGTLAVQQSLGLDNRWIDADAIDRLVPGIDRRDLLGGTYSPRDGSVSPIDTMAAYVREALELGVTFLFDDPVQGFEITYGKVSSVKSRSGAHASGYVVNAAGAWAAAVGALAGTALPIRPDMHEAGITEPLQDFFDPMVVDIRREPGSANIYFYQNEIGQVVFCLTPDPALLGDDHRSTSAFLPMVAKRLVKIFPRLASARVRRVWRGLYPNTPDGSPIIDRDPTVENLYHAVGMCGQGFMLGPGVGMLVARMVTNNLERDDAMVLAALTLKRPFGGAELLT